MEVLFNKKRLLIQKNSLNHKSIKEELFNRFGIKPSDYYLLVNGKLVYEDDIFDNTTVHLVPRLIGGKGGFGSMLRAIGAQIEKTTNREACRDLSGRRLRDINEEQRLKNWIAAQAEREKETAERKQKKLERLCELPKHEFKDEQYDKERSELPEKVVDAVEQGLKVAGASAVAVKRKKETKNIKKKKLKLWVDADVEDELSSTDDSAGEDNSDSNCPNRDRLSGSGGSNVTTEEGQGDKEKKEDSLTNDADINKNTTQSCGAKETTEGEETKKTSQEA